MPVDGNGWILMKQKTCNLLKLRPEGKTSETDAQLEKSFHQWPGFFRQRKSGRTDGARLLVHLLETKGPKNTSTGSQSRENSKDPMDLPLIPPAD